MRYFIDEGIKIIRVGANGSYSMAIDSEFNVYIWGFFSDKHRNCVSKLHETKLPKPVYIPSKSSFKIDKENIKKEEEKIEKEYYNYLSKMINVSCLDETIIVYYVTDSQKYLISSNNIYSMGRNDLGQGLQKDQEGRLNIKQMCSIDSNLLYEKNKRLKSGKERILHVMSKSQCMTFVVTASFDAAIHDPFR